MILVILGCVYALSSERAIYYGRFGIKLLVHHGWSWLCCPGPYPQPVNTKTESHITHICGISLYYCLILHLLDIYADEVAVSNQFLAFNEQTVINLVIFVVLYWGLKCRLPPRNLNHIPFITYECCYCKKLITASVFKCVICSVHSMIEYALVRTVVNMALSCAS